MYYLMACQSPQPTTIGCRRKLLKRFARWVPTWRWPGPGGASLCETGPSESACRCAPCSGWKRATRVGMGVYAAALWLMGRADALPDLADPALDRGALALDVRQAQERLARRNRAGQ